MTFLFTDVEGSTQLWEQHPGLMEAALERHDEILRTAIEAAGGYVFSTAGDAFAAAFTGAEPAVNAAIQAQQTLSVGPWPNEIELRVRMGLHTGEAHERSGDYFGSTLNRAARVMSAGHGGQILVSHATAGLCGTIELADLGERRLKDLSNPTQLFQVHADGLEKDFAPLRTVDGVPGNLSSQATSFVGRELETRELCDLVGSHRLVTLTGVGGVGKTRLALQVAAELSDNFNDGVWLIELAGVGDPDAVPDAVATELGVTASPGSTTTEGLIGALAGRRMLVVLDNCEHVLDAAADLVEAITKGTETVKLLATSRESLRVNGEHVWSVPSLDVAAGSESVAVELFVDRARAVDAAFSLDTEAEAAAVTEICRRLDGVALAIELAAARMVSMSAQDVRERLDDRFRLLSGSRRGLERHQTLRHAVTWSYDLLDNNEQGLLERCSVFADGFDLAAATHIASAHSDEYAVLDLLDSLVRKSLITTERVEGHVRYGMLETIRQFAEEQLAATGSINETRDRHAKHFAAQAIVQWDIWNSPQQRAALDWVDAELANLRIGFRWAADNDDLTTAAAIAAHTTMMSWVLLRYEPIQWIDEILGPATDADIPQLPRLYTAGAWCSHTGSAAEALVRAQTATALETDQRYEPFEYGWASFMEAMAHRYSGRFESWIAICEDLATWPTAFARTLGLCGLILVLPAVGRGDEARAIADTTLAAARRHGNPSLIVFAMQGVVSAFTESDTTRGLITANEAIDFCRRHRLLYQEATISRNAAGFERIHGNLGRAVELFEHAIESYHSANNRSSIVTSQMLIAVLFVQLKEFEVAAVIHGFNAHRVSGQIIGLTEALHQLRAELSEAAFDDLVAQGHAMPFDEAMHYTRHHLRQARHELSTGSS